MPGFFAVFIAAAAVLPLWEIQLESTPRCAPHLVSSDAEGQVLLIPMGNAGLGAWSSGGMPLPGFPVSRGIGVVLRPAAVPGSTGETLIAYADNEGTVHLIDQTGRHAHGWPVTNSSNVITGITALDINDDGQFEIAFGTGDGRVHLLDIRGRSLSGFPVNLNSQLLHQPSSVSLGGGRGRGLVCATNNGRVTVLGRDGGDLPGWPVFTGYPAGTAPVTGDLNGDGQADVLFATQDGLVHMFSILGQKQSGWPVYMDARPVSGSPAVGLLGEGGQLPQLAIASLDSMVYLINGDGSLAGAWRWPNKTDSRPFQPLMAFTAEGPSVLAAANSGSLYAWDASGARRSGHPFINPGGVIFPPVVSDMNGNGQGEIILLNPSGRVSAYPLAQYSRAVCSWPLPMGDQYNSGAYGSGFLPVAEVEQLSGKFSGSVSMAYSVRGADHTGISVAYSTDAGYTWYETVNYAERQGEITWHSNLDLPSRDERSCRVKITPYSLLGPGESGISGLLHIDNNQPPTIFLETPVKIDDSRYRFGYAVDDPEGDTIQLQAQYSLDGGNTWDLMRLDGSTLEIEPWFYGEPVTWNAARDIGHRSVEDLWIRIRAADADPGPWYVIQGLHIDTDRLPSAQIIAPADRAQGRVKLGVRLADPEMSPLDVMYEYSVNSGESWLPATVIEAEHAGIGRYEYDIYWESEIDLPGYSGNQVRFRAIPFDVKEGIPVPSAPFRLDNNHPPSVAIQSPSRYDVFRGVVPIGFVITDRESDPVRLELEYRLHQVDHSWQPARGLMTSGPFSEARYRATLHWNSSVDLPDASMLDVEIRLVAIDGDTTRSAPLGPLTLENTSLPQLVRANVSGIDTDRGEAAISFEIADPRQRTVNLKIDYSINGGATWRQGSVSGSATGLRSHSYEGNFNWHYRTDIMGHRGTVVLRITPEYENGLLGRPRFIEQVFR